MPRAGLSRGCILPSAACRVVLHPSAAPRSPFWGAQCHSQAPSHPPVASTFPAWHHLCTPSPVPGGSSLAPASPHGQERAWGAVPNKSINPAGPAEGFSSFNGCSSSMYRALHTEAGAAPGLPAGLARGHPARRACAGMGPAAPISASISQDLPVQGLCLCPLCVPGVPGGAVLCAERARWAGGAPHRPGGGSSRCLHPCPSPRPPVILPPSRGPRGQWAPGASCPCQARGSLGGVSGEGAVGGTRVPIANGMKAGAERGCRCRGRVAPAMPSA